MNRKLDFPALLLFVALLFGTIVRFYPAITNGFPLNDGGMFYTMVQDLKSNGYALPQFTNYNHADIPFAYPPFGFYAAALLSAFLPGSDLLIFLYLPALVNTFSILAFYLFAKETLNSRTLASLAVTVFALSPRSFLWQVMGGGITRSFGMLFLLLMLWQVIQLFKEYENKHLILTILFGAGAVLSHPQTALHAALGGAVIFLFYGLNKRGFISAFFVGLGVILLTSPWWGLVLSRHGLQPFISAGQTSQRTLESYLSLLQFGGLSDYLLFPVTLLAFIGVYIFFKQRNYFLVTWMVLANLIDPRGGGSITLLAVSMLAGVGLLKLSAWVSRSSDEQAETVFMKRSSLTLVFGAIFLFLLAAMISDFQLLNTSLKSSELKMIEWVKFHVDENKTFLLATGSEFSMSDPMQEWFPTLTEQYSATTLQGLEWTMAERFFPWSEQLIAFQHCADAACVDEWSTRNGVDYDYLVVMIPEETDEQGMAVSLQSLAASVRSSDVYSLAYESERVLVFEYKK